MHYEIGRQHILFLAREVEVVIGLPPHLYSVTALPSKTYRTANTVVILSLCAVRMKQNVKIGVHSRKLSQN